MRTSSPRRSGSSLGLILALMLLGVVPGTTQLHGADPPVPRPVSELLPEDAGLEWRVGFAALWHDGLLAEHRHLARGIPLLLLESLGELSLRSYLPDERKAVAAAIVADATSSAGKELTRLRNERDEVLFRRYGERREREEANTAAAGKVRVGEMELARLRRFDPHGLELPQKATLRMVENDSERLFAATTRPASALRTTDLDALVYGSLERLGEYLHLELVLFSKALGGELGRVSLTAFPEEMSSLLPEIEDELAALLVGHDVGRIWVQPGRDDVAVWLEDELLGYGALERRFLEPGLYRVSIQGRNVPEQSVELSLSAGERAEVVFEHEQRETWGIVLESTPSGADVYSDSVWIGRTPLRVELGESNEHIVLLRDGFYRSQLIVGPQTAPQLERQLEPDLGSEGAHIERRRNAFYMAFGLFILSVPVAILSNGVYENLATMVPPDGSRAPGLSESEAERLRRQRDMAYYATWGGVAVSTGLFVTSAVQLSRYVRAAQASHTR